jgi:predicted nucleotidyltransferase
MPTVRRTLVGILRDLAALEQRFALVGGLAVSARTEPRTTRDVDIAVAVDDDSAAEALIFALQQRGYSVATVIEHEMLGRLATVRLQPPGGGIAGALVDLLFASSGIEAEVVGAAESLEVVRGVHAPVATIGHLLAMKLLARDDEERPQDAVDLRALVRQATSRDLELAEAATIAIERLGTHRGRDLSRLLQELLASRRR